MAVKPGFVSTNPPTLNDDDLPVVPGITVIHPFQYSTGEFNAIASPGSKAIYWRLNPTKNGVLRINTELSGYDIDPDYNFWASFQVWGSSGGWGSGADYGTDRSVGVTKGVPLTIAVMYPEFDATVTLRISDYAPYEVVQPASVETVTVAYEAHDPHQITPDFTTEFGLINGGARSTSFLNAYTSAPSAGVLSDEIECLWRSDGALGSGNEFHNLYGSTNVIIGDIAGDWNPTVEAEQDALGGWGAGYAESDETWYRVRDGVPGDLHGTPYNGSIVPPPAYVPGTLTPMGPPPSLPELFRYGGGTDPTPNISGYHWAVHLWEPELQYDVGGYGGFTTPQWHDAVAAPKACTPSLYASGGFIVRFPWNLIASMAVPVGSVRIYPIWYTHVDGDDWFAPPSWDMRLQDPELLKLWVTFDRTAPAARTAILGHDPGDIPVDYPDLEVPVPLTPSGSLELRVDVQGLGFTYDPVTPDYLTQGEVVGHIGLTDAPEWYEISDSQITELMDPEEGPYLLMKTKPSHFDSSSTFGVDAGTEWSPYIKMRIDVPAYVSFTDLMPPLPEAPNRERFVRMYPIYN